MPRLEKKVLQTITEELDQLANLYNKTKDQAIKKKWYNKINFYFYKKKSTNI
jgi:hypothetical protein